MSTPPEGPVIGPEACPALAAHVRMTYDRSRGGHVLLGPESVIVLNPTGADILELCTGRRPVAEIVEELHRRYERVVDDEVTTFLRRLARRRWVVITDG